LAEKERERRYEGWIRAIAKILLFLLRRGSKWIDKEKKSSWWVGCNSEVEESKLMCRVRWVCLERYDVRL
jgi:hypothetical protein